MTNHERMNKKMDEKMEKTTKKTTKAAKSAPAAKDEKMSIEEKKAKLQEKLQELLALAKKKKNSLEYQEISEFFKDMELDADEFEKILDFLETNNIDVLRIMDEDDIDDDIIAVNPGSLSYPRQEGRQPSYAIMEIDREEKVHFTIAYLR